MCSCNHWVKLSPVCILLKRILIVALANSGIIFAAGLPTSIVGICTELGKKYSFPSSKGSAMIFCNIVIKWWAGFSALLELAVCPWIPLAERKKLIAPRLPIFILSPTVLLEVGSPTMQWSRAILFFFIHSIILIVPLTASFSSSPVIINDICPPKLEPCLLIKEFVAEIKHAILLFMSSAPLPNSFPSAIVAEKGGYFQDFSLPGGTTSVWPAKARCFPDSPILAYRFSISSNPSSLKVSLVDLKPSDLRCFSTTLRAPSSLGVTLAHWTSSCVRAI